MYLLYSLLDYLLLAVQIVIFVQVILSWLVAFNVVGRHGQLVGGIMYGLDRLLQPIYRPIRSVLPDTGALDLAPMVVLLIVIFLRRTVLPTVFASLVSDVM